MTALIPLPQHDPLNQLPPAASTFASDVDGLYYFCTYVSIFFFFLIAGLLVFTTVRHRRKTEDQPAASNVTHNTTLEVVWTLIPTIILMVIFVWGWKGNLAQSVAPGDALQYRVVAKQWNWNFFHPGDTTAAPELWVPIDTPVKFTMSSGDVLHSMFIPAFRAKRDVLPGRYQTMWFRATVLGDYPLFCTEYCGDDHSRMNTIVHVVTKEEFAERPWDTRPEDPVEWGKQIYQLNCFACHTTDGSPRVGPSFKGLWGKEEAVIVDGAEQRVTVDEEYFKESVRDPNAKMVKGFENLIMTAFDESLIPDEGLDALIEYVKTLKD